MILRQFLHTDPAIAALYIAGCGARSAGIVVDPVDAPEVYLRRATELGMSIRYVADTHVHTPVIRCDDASRYPAGSA